MARLRDPDERMRFRYNAFQVRGIRCQFLKLSESKSGKNRLHLDLADPDGNEFCVLRALRPEEIAAQAGG